jgi:hypothetical protein
VGTYDMYQKELAKCKADVLKMEYELFLERNKPKELVNSQKIEKILHQRKFVYLAFGQAANLAGKTWEYYVIGGAIQEYIRSKGHKPKQSKVLLVIAIVFSIFSLEGIASGSAVGTAFFATIAIAFWVWWANYRRF